MKTKLPAVIVMAEKQRDLVERLTAYCRDLDGSKITILEGGAGTRLQYPKCNDAAFHQAAEHFKGKAFIWMEPDSIPLVPNWQQILTDEYHKSGKEFMLSSDTHPPHDLVGGIGVYGPNSHWFIPKTFRKNAWDFWMFEHAKVVTHETPLIQHSYGRYDHLGKSHPHRFPKDRHILRPDAVLFHRDKFQDLVTGGSPATKELVFKHGGDLGDIVAALPIMRQQGGGKLILFHDPAAPVGQRGRESLEGARYNAIKPLLEVQEYITSVEWGEGVDTSNFRTVVRAPNENLAERQARHAGIWPLDLSPWLTVPSFEKHNRIICARSGRYPNPIGFPWRELRQTYGDRLLFVGLPDEHAAFVDMIGGPVEHAKTENLLDVATLMAGSPMVVANQSCPLWIAMGLGSKVVCEVCPSVPNSMIHRPGSFFAMTATDMAVVRRAFASVPK